MKKFLIALSLVTAFLFATGCDIDVNLTAVAKAELIDANSGTITPTQTMSFGPYTHYSLTDAELEAIFLTLIKGNGTRFTSASLFIDYQDNITGQLQRSEEYGVLYEYGHYSFVLMTY
jgi:hypothetical protein